MYVLVFIQNYWYEILLVPATWYMILHILYLVISSSSMREIPRFYTAIVWFLTNLVWLISLRIIITERNDICWIYACFLLKTNLFFKLHNILYIWILSDILLCEIILWETCDGDMVPLSILYFLSLQMMKMTLIPVI